MEQFEKVVKGLECHSSRGDCTSDCPYISSGCCSEPLCADALALIRQQQERIAELEAANASWQTFAPFLHAHGLLNEMEGV